MGQAVGNAGREKMAEKNSVPGDSSRCTRNGGSNGQTPSLSPTHGQRSWLDTHSTRCVHLCACVCVHVCGCPDGLLVESWPHNPEDEEMCVQIPGQKGDPRAEGKFLFIKIVPPASICKQVTLSCIGEQSTLAVPH